MGFFNKLFSKETKEEQKIKEQIKGNETTYAHASTENIPLCNGCGQYIETSRPRMIKNGGKLLYFHKRCIKRMQSGQLPMPKLTNDIESVEGKDL